MADQTHTAAEVLRTIPLSRIVVPDGFNPRGQVDDDTELQALAETIRQRGVLQPIRVRDNGDGSYALIAGERRYRAAVIAALTELPALVRAAGAGDQHEQADLLVDALIENDVRVNLDPLQRALGYRRLLDQGLTVKGVAQLLGGIPQARVRERLQVLELPESLQLRVAAGEVPQRAIKPLGTLARIHPQLAECAAAEVIACSDESSDAYDPGIDWAYLADHALELATYDSDKLPSDVYIVGEAYPLSRFTLSDAAQSDVAAYAKLRGGEVETVAFRRDQLETAEGLGAVHTAGWRSIVVGQDVADQLAGDTIAAALKAQRKIDRDRKAWERQNPSAPDDAAGASDAGASDAAASEAAAERAKQREEREQAVASNLDLGRAVVAQLSRVKVDERVLKILTAIDLAGDLGDIAMRGARYGFPGWFTEVEARGGKTKVEYLGREEGKAKALEYLAGAKTAGEIAGRCVALIVMAVFADQRAVAQSSRCWHTVTCGSVPWMYDVGELIDELVKEQLPPATLQALKPVLAERAKQRKQRAADDRERAQAAKRVIAAEAKLDQLDAAALHAVVEDASLAFGTYSQRRYEVEARVREVLEAPGEGEQQSSEEVGD